MVGNSLFFWVVWAARGQAAIKFSTFLVQKRLKFMFFDKNVERRVAL